MTHSLHELLAEVADVDWRHPAWWGLWGATTVLEASVRALGDGAGHGELYATYLSANGGPRADTFMAWPRGWSDGSAAARVARAVARARAAVDAVGALDGTLPGQPLQRTLAWKDGWLERVPMPDGPLRVAFITPRGVVVAPLTAGGDAALARALGAYVAGGAPAALLHDDGPAAIAVALGEQPEPSARHLHRHAWTDAGGPWLGVGDTATLELVTTCHLVVDGYGHGRLSAEIAARLARATPPLAEAAAGLAGAEPPIPALAAVDGAEPLDFAGVQLADGHLGFAAAAYALGRALERAYRAHWPAALRRAARHGPTFQVPLVPGARDELDWRGKRVLFALMALEMKDGAFEPFAAFAARVQRLLEREAAAAGLLTRLLHASAHAPVPAALRRRLLTWHGRPHPLLPMIEVLSGRGALASMRFAAGERPDGPLYAASSPPMDDSVVLTLIHHDADVTATMCASETGAARPILDAWQEELAGLPASEDRAPAAAPSR